MNGSGASAFSFAPPTMVDASGATSSAVTLSLAKSGSTFTVTLSANPTWLADPTRAYPVTIDPTMVWRGTGSNVQDCSIEASGPTTTYCSSQTLNVGWNGSADRALLQFPIQNTIGPTKTVQKAILGLDLYGKTTTTPIAVSAYQVTRSWTTGATWNTYDGTHAWTTAGGDFASTASASQSSVGGSTPVWYTWDLTSLAKSWVSRSVANDGVILKEPTENQSNVLSFYSGNYPTSSDEPYMEVTYLAGSPGKLPWYTFVNEKLTDQMSLSVNVGNGNLIVANDDLSMPGVGLPLSLERHYNSISVGYIKDFGHGWTSTVGPDVSLWNTIDGDVEVAGPSYYALSFIKNPDGSYTPPPGADATLVQNGDGTFTLTQNVSGVKMNFKATGSLSSVVDRSGNTIADTFNTDGTLASLTDTLGTSTTFQYSSANLITQMTDPAGRIYTYGYNTTTNDLTSYVDPCGNANGTTVPYCESGDSSLTATQLAAKYTTTYGYDGSHRLIQITDPLGNITAIAYDGNNRATSITRAYGTSYATTTSFTYNNGNTVVTDGNGNTTTYYYDGQTRVTQINDGFGHPTLQTWTSDNHLATVTRPCGSATGASGYAFCESGDSSLTASQLLAKYTTTYTYDANNNLIETDAANGSKTTSTHNTPGFPTTSPSASGSLQPPPRWRAPTSAPPTRSSQQTSPSRSSSMVAPGRSRSSGPRPRPRTPSSTSTMSRSNSSTRAPRA